jgi:hypothetical protein
MLIIRKEQMAALGRLRQVYFVDRLVKHLSTEYPLWYEERDAQGAREFVQKVMERGDRQNIRGMWAIATLLELMVEFGEGFERSPDRGWALQILSHPSLPDRLKVSVLSERLRERTGGRRIVEFQPGEDSGS